MSTRRIDAVALVARGSDTQTLAMAVRSVWGLPQDWGSGGYRHWLAGIIGWLEFLSEAGTERAIIDSATNLEQQVGAASRPAHLL